MLIKDLSHSKNEKHIIDNRAKISENSNEFPLSLVKCLKTKFLRQNSIVPNEKLQRSEKLYLLPAIIRIFSVVNIQKQ